MSGTTFLPNARREGLLVREHEGEVLVYDSARHKAFCLNRPAAVVWEHCDGETPVPELARRLGEELEGGADEAVVWYALGQLSRTGLLRERAAPHQARGVGRREVLRRLGAAAVLLPVVLAIAVPTAQAQASCVGTNRPAGCPCSSNNQCASNNCSNGTCA